MREQDEKYTQKNYEVNLPPLIAAETLKESFLIPQLLDVGIDGKVTIMFSTAIQVPSSL